MQIELVFKTKITNNTAKTINPIITKVLVIAATTTSSNDETETTAAADKQEQEY